MGQLGLMRQLADEPGLSGAQLARRLLITPQGAQLALTSLERSGLVERKPDPAHGRILRAYLTDQGREVTAAVYADAVAAHNEVFGVLDDDEQKALHDLLGSGGGARHRPSPARGPRRTSVMTVNGRTRQDQSPISTA